MARTQQFLQNPSGRLLNVRIAGAGNGRWMRKHLFAQSHRFRSLHMDDFDTKRVELLRLYGPARFLESLHLEGDLPTLQASHDTLVSLPMLFSGIMPRLRYLDLAPRPSAHTRFLKLLPPGYPPPACLPPSPLMYITTLTHLTLHAPLAQPQLLDAGFILLLRHNPHLKQLVLVAYELVALPLPPAREKIETPALAQLVLYQCNPRLSLDILGRVRCGPGSSA